MKKPAVLRHAGFLISNGDRSDLDQRPSRGRALGAAAGATRLRLARCGAALAGTGQLFRLRRHRAFDELEADLAPVFGIRLVLEQHDADVTAALELAEQHFVRERLLDVLL